MQKLLDLQAQLQTSGIAGRDLTITAGEGFLRISDADMECYPVFLVIAGDKMTCWTNVISQSQVDADKVAELNTAMLTYNGLPGNLSNTSCFKFLTRQETKCGPSKTIS